MTGSGALRAELDRELGLAGPEASSQFVSDSGAVLRNRERTTLVVQSGEGSVHLPLF